MKLKKAIAVVLSLCITAGLISGCTGNGDKGEESQDSTITIGKYLEENVEIPVKQNETILRLLKNSNGSVEIYVQGENVSYGKYTSLDGKEWKAEDASWLAQISGGKVVSLAAGKDGNSYAIVTDESSNMHLLRQTGEGTAEEISVPELNVTGDQPGSEFYSFGTELKVMENGNLVLEGDREVKVYSQEDGTLLYSLPYEKNSTDARNPVDINGDYIVLPDKDNTGFDVWSTEEKKEAAMSYGAEVRYGRVILEKDNNLYFLNKDGIHHIVPDGTLVETLVDGSGAAMGLPTAYVVDFVKGAGDDFYALYEMSNGQMSVKHYYYDKDGGATGSGKKLNIYSLEENATVRQAVGIFNQKYPDTEVSYKTGEADSSATKADKIRVLNTELLNKSGADVLILDGLPVNSLMEKGVLKDISNIITPLLEDGTLSKNQVEYYQQEDGKLYTIPAKYGIPILYGNQEMTDAMESLDTLENWLDTHENQPMFTYVSYGELTRLFVNMYYNELFDGDGKLNQDKLEQCLSCAKKAGDRVQAEMEKNYVSDSGENLEDISGVYFSDWGAGDSMGILEQEQAASAEMVSLMDMMIPFTIMREKSFPLLFNKDTFVPHGLVGINSASLETELAEEFLKVLFSQEVQGYDLRDGFPMNQNAEAQLIEQGLDYLDEERGSLVMVGGSDDSESYSFGMPLKTEIKELLERAKELKKPAEADTVLLDMIFEEAKMYYEGNQELEQTIQGITAKVDTYRAE